MDWKIIVEYYYRHRGAIIGSLIGLVFAITFLIFGFIKVVFIALCITIGYYIGKRISEDKDFFSKMFEKVKDRVFPPGMYK